MAKNKPLSLEPVLNEIFQFINSQDGSVNIPLSKSILEIAKKSPKLIPINPVIQFLSDKDSFIRESGAKILGYIGHLMIEDVIDPLINKALNDEEWNVREATVSSIGNIIDHIEDKEPIIEKLVLLLDDAQVWVRRSVINILSGIDQIKASQIPYEKLLKSISDDDSKVREASAGLLKIYSNQIDRIFDKIITLLEDESEDVRKSMINVTVEIVQDIGLETILSRLLQNLSDEGSMNAQRSISVILGRTAKYENEKTKKRVIALLKIRCEMSQDPIICKTLNDLRKS
jgi:HEAT repeat protein